MILNILKMNKNCLIYNFGQHYRIGIFKLLDKKLNCDLFFGDKMGDVKKVNYSEFKNFKKELHNIQIFSSIYWQKGAVRLFFKNYKNYILLGEYYCLSTWVIVLLSFFSNKKVYLWTHGWYGNESIIKIIVKKIFFNLSDGILLYGNYAKDLMINEGFDENKLHVVFNSLDYEKQLKVRSTLSCNKVYENQFKNSNPVLIFIGRLTKVKKLEDLIEAQIQLLKSNINVNVVFIGEGDMKVKLQNLTNQKGLKNVWFYGATYEESEIGNLIYNADICVSPGNVGLTAMHSMVYGTPVITNNEFTEQMPEFEAIESEITGAFFEKGNIKSMVSAISNWLLVKKGRNQIRKDCFNKIDSYFNPNYQLKVIRNVLNEK